jgi:ADP-ribose pyrophosphatase YjhB (NUDIX family)
MKCFSIIASGIIKRDKLAIEYHPQSSFKFAPHQQATADSIWAAKLKEARAKKIRFYDGKLYSLLSSTFNSENGILSLSLGHCRYKDYAVTRTSRIIDSDGNPVYADPLAICCAVVTSDEKILIGKRIGVDGSLDKYHVVGGFLERTKDGQDGDPDPFEAISREIDEETGVEIRADEITCLGLIYDHVAPHPEICFYARTGLDYNQVQKLNPRDMEVHRWEYIDDSSKSMADFIIMNENKIAVPGLANLLFYGEMKYGRNWGLSILSMNS